MRITAKGQVTIPQAIREEAGFLPHTEVEFVIEPDGSVRLIKTRHARRLSRGAEAVALLRRARHLPMTTDEIMALTRGDD